MKHLTLILALIAFQMGYTQQPVEEKKPLLLFSGISLYDGRADYDSYSIGSPMMTKNIAAKGSPLPGVTISPNFSYNLNGNWAKQNDFAIGLNAQFTLNPERLQNKGNGRHVFSVGLWYSNFIDISADLNNIGYATVDSFTMGTTPFKVDSLNYKRFTFSNTFSTLCADLNYQYSSNPQARIYISAGLGVSMGATLANQYSGSYTEGYSRNLYPDTKPFYWALIDYSTIELDNTVNYEVNDGGKSRSAFVFRPYIPITLAFRLSKTDKVLKHLALFGMLKGGVEYLVWGNSSIKSWFYEKSVGIRYTL